MIFEVGEDQFARLDEDELTELLRMLLLLEARDHGIPIRAINTTLNTKAADGGLDAAVRWDDGPSSTHFILSRDVGFQNKADDLGPQDCAKELVRTMKAPTPPAKAAAKSVGKKRKKAAKQPIIKKIEMVKKLVDELLERGGDYVLVTTAKVGYDGVRARIKKMREKLIALKRPYAKKARLHVFPANTIRTWTNKYIPAMVYVQSKTGHVHVRGLRTWDEWCESFPITLDYVPDAKTLQVKEAVREGLERQGTALRLVGFSGLGKTRLALEATRPESTDKNSPAVYFDAAHDKNALKDDVFEWRREKRAGVIVVDNCSPDLHLDLEKEVANSKMSLLTIDDCVDDTRGKVVVKVEPSNDAHIAGVVKSIIKGIADDDANKIAQFASGFISYAELLAGVWQKGGSVKDVVPRDVQLIGILFGRGGERDEIATKAIQACALVDSADLGEDGDSAEAKFLANVAEIDTKTLYRYVFEFERRGLIERHGPYIRVRIYPLALGLCASWWERCMPKRAADLLGAAPASMIESLCNRLRMLDFVPQAKSLTQKLCGPQGPFGQAEVLCSDRGARAFRALVELNPEACISALSSVVMEYGYDDLRRLEEPRREWVWALERLIFHLATYARSADVLLRLAVAEFEKIANNATGVLLQTFHVQLPGTEAPLEKRGKYLKQLFASDEDEVRQLALRALDSALTTEYYTRTAGAEDQGSGPALKEYQPKSLEEVTSYWRTIIDAAAEAVESKHLASDDVRNTLAPHLRGFVRVGHLDLVAYIVGRARKWSDSVWESGLTALGDVSRFEASAWPSELKARLQSWIQTLSPDATDFASRLLLTVSRPNWSDFYDEQDQAGNKQPSTAEKSALRLAEECARDFDRWRPYLTSLFSGEQRSGTAFGERLGELLEDPASFIDLALATLKANAPNGNSIVLHAFVKGAAKSKSHLIDETINVFLSKPALYPYATLFIAGFQPSLMTLLKLVALAKSGSISPLSLRSFAYGRAIAHLGASDAVSFAKAIYDLEDESAPWTGLELLYMYCFGDQTKKLWPQVRATVRDFHVAGRLKLGRPTNQHDSHVWKETASKLLEENDPELAKTLAEQLVAACEAGAHSFQVPLDVAYKLLASYGDATWPIFGAELLKKPSGGSWTLTQYLGRGIRGSSEEAGGPIESLSHDLIEDWLRSHSAGARGMAMMIRPLMPHGDDAYAWTPLARLLIDKYGNKEVLAALSGNIHSGSWSGLSRAAHYTKIRRLSDELRHHSKATVRAWAGRMVRDMDDWLARDQRQVDARNVGRW